MAVAVMAASLASPLQHAAGQDLFGWFSDDASVSRSLPTGPAISRPGPGSSLFSPFSPFGRMFSPFHLQSRPDPVDRSAYRTLCVRMCDGYYFPISYATSEANLTRDAERCAAACGGDARLFYHPSPGGDVETMLDLTGRTYASYPTAFKYRRTLVQGCQCRPQPWTEAELARHRAYAAAEKVSAQASASTAAGEVQAGRGGETAGSSAMEQDTMIAPSPIDRRELEEKGPSVTAPPPRTRPKRAQGQGWDWLFGSGGNVTVPKKSSYMSSGTP